MENTRDQRTPSVMDGALLIVKSGVPNHTAFDIPDDPCLSKFGALRRMSPHAADNFRAFVWRLYRC